ncbi:hypothetical protein STEG23_010834, partial [Scotinomys teguina]
EIEKSVTTAKQHYSSAFERLQPTREAFTEEVGLTVLEEANDGGFEDKALFEFAQADGECGECEQALWELAPLQEYRGPAQ